MESFFGTLKTELVHQREYLDREAARRDLFAYIEGYYNRQRIHSAIGYITPDHEKGATPLALSGVYGKGMGGRVFRNRFGTIASAGAIPSAPAAPALLPPPYITAYRVKPPPELSSAP